MAVLDNTVLAANISKSQDIEMITRFNAELDQLSNVLGLFAPEVVAAGTALFQYTVTGTLSATTVAEGDEVPLSEYEVDRTALDPLDIKPYRKLTTAQAVLKGGYENAIAKTDRKMLAQVRDGILTDFFTLLGTGTATVTAAGLQAAFAQAAAKLQDETEKNSDFTGTLVFFVNPFDIADYLAGAQVTQQTVFGMTYLQSFMGVQNVFVTNKVAAGTMYATPVENIHIYGIDFSALGAAGMEYTTQDGSLIGVHHDAAYNRTSCETYVLRGCEFVPEYKNYIAKVTVNDADPQKVSVVGTVETTTSQSS